MGIHRPIGELVCEANVLQNLDNGDPPMNFHCDFKINKIATLDLPSADADFNFLNNGPDFS